MGHDTTILVNNDYLGDIAKDTAFGAALRQAVLALSNTNGRPAPIGHGAYAVETHHQDGITVFAVGDRRALILGGCGVSDDKQHIVKEIARQHNLRVLSETEFRELNAKPTVDEVREWAEQYGLVAVSKDAYEAAANLPKDAVRAAVEEATAAEEAIPSLEKIREWAKHYGWRLITLRRKEEKKMKVGVVSSKELTPKTLRAKDYLK